MEVIFYYFIIVFSLFFLGYGFTTLSLPNKTYKETIWLSPWVGTVLITVYVPILSFGRIPLTLGIYVIILSTLFINIYSLFRMPTLIHKKIKFIAPLIILIVSLFLFYEFKKVINNLSISIYPTEFRLSFVKAGHFIGIYSIIDFFVILIKQNLPLIRSILSTVYLIVFFPMIFSFLKRFFTDKYPYIRLTLSSFLLLMFFYIFINYYSMSLDQLIFSGVILLILIISFDNFPSFSKVKPNISNITLYDILLALSLFSLSTIYPPGFKIIFALFFVSILSSLFLIKNTNMIFFLVKIFFLTIIINPIIISMAYHIK